jgi:sulfite reductase (ferredoxin)
MILSDYDANAQEGEYYADYFERQGKMYFYHLLKPLADVKNLTQDDYLDWDSAGEDFEIQKAVGECAGVIIDLVSTLIYETEEKYGWAIENFEQGNYADAIYHAYNVLVSGAKALLLGTKAKTNTQILVMREFDKYFGQNQYFDFDTTFENHVLRINQNEPSKAFAEAYIASAGEFLDNIRAYREAQLAEQVLGKEIVNA